MGHYNRFGYGFPMEGDDQQSLALAQFLDAFKHEIVVAAFQKKDEAAYDDLVAKLMESVQDFDPVAGSPLSENTKGILDAIAEQFSPV